MGKAPCWGGPKPVRGNWVLLGLCVGGSQAHSRPQKCRSGVCAVTGTQRWGGGRHAVAGEGSAYLKWREMEGANGGRWSAVG